jgi:hypothetical protein
MVPFSIVYEGGALRWIYPFSSLIGLAESQARIWESYKNQCRGAFIGS